MGSATRTGWESSRCLREEVRISGSKRAGRDSEECHSLTIGRPLMLCGIVFMGWGRRAWLTRSMCVSRRVLAMLRQWNDHHNPRSTHLYHNVGRFVTMED